jgi:membrane protease YdiL (CAAX protease family)
MNGAFELCGVCGQHLRVGVRFCSRCGVEQGLVVPRDAGAGRELHEPAPVRRLHVGDRGLTIALVAYFVMLMPSIYLLSKGGADLTDVLWAEALIAAVGVAGMMSMWRDTLPLLGMPRIERPFDVVIGVAGVAAVLLTVYLIATLLPQFFLSDTFDYKLEGKTLSYTIFHAAVVPAFAEELAFRGVVLTALCGVFRDRTAVIVSAMLFAIIHLSPISFLHLTLLGVLLGATRLRTRSIWPCVLIHLVYNAIVVLVQW